MDKPTNAPACFSAASVFSHDSDVCRKCEAFAKCADASMQTLQQIRQIINVEDLLKRHEKAKRVSREALAEEDRRKAEQLPPGNGQAPTMKSAERKTQMVKVVAEITANDDSIIATLPVKPKQVAIALCKNGLMSHIKKDVAAGRNTLAKTGPGFLREAIALLLSGGFSRAELRAALENNLGWQQAAAASHVSIAVSIFTAFGMAQEVEGRIVPAESLAR